MSTLKNNFEENDKILGAVARKVDNFIQWIVISSIAGKGIKINYTKDIELASVKKCL